MDKYVEDFSCLPFNIVYGVESAEDKLELLNKLITSCIERHAPLKNVKMTRPPAPWIKDLNTANLKYRCKEARFTAHNTHYNIDWEKFRSIRNELKQKIKFTKRSFYKRALSSKRPKENMEVYTSYAKSM